MNDVQIGLSLFVSIMRAEPTLFMGLVALVGSLFGSFANVVAYRLPIIIQRNIESDAREDLGLDPTSGHPFRLSLWSPRSACPMCKSPIPSVLLLPVAGWALAGGRCRSCAEPISMRYPAVEIATAIFSMAAAFMLGPTPQLVAMLFLIWAAVPLALIDLDQYLLPDRLVELILWIGLIAGAAGLFVSAASAVVSVVVTYTSVGAVRLAASRFSGQEMMGAGDVKLLAALAAWMPLGLMPLVVLGACLSGALFYALLKRARLAIPFGPMILVAAIPVIVGQRQLLELFPFLAVG